MNKKKLLKILFIIILFVFIIFAINGIRNFTIISKLQNKLQDKLNSTNFYIKIDYKQYNVVNEIYVKDNNVKMSLVNNKETNDIMRYKIGNKITIFMNNELGKTMYETNDIEDFIEYTKFLDMVNTDTFMEKIINSFTSFIKSEKVDNKECYVIINRGMYKNYMYADYDPDILKIYIDKETALPVKVIDGYYNENDTYTTYFEYKFGTVTDEEFELPDKSEYKLMK